VCVCVCVCVCVRERERERCTYSLESVLAECIDIMIGNNGSRYVCLAVCILLILNDYC